MSALAVIAAIAAIVGALSPLAVPFIERWLEKEELTVRLTPPLRLSLLETDRERFGGGADVYAVTFLIESRYRKALNGVSVPIEFTGDRGRSLISLTVSTKPNFPTEVVKLDNTHLIKANYLNPKDAINAVAIFNSYPGTFVQPRIENISIGVVNAELSDESQRNLRNRSLTGLLQLFAGLIVIVTIMTVARSQNEFREKTGALLNRIEQINFQRMSKSAVEDEIREARDDLKRL